MFECMFILLVMYVIFIRLCDSFVMLLIRALDEECVVFMGLWLKSDVLDLED